MRRLTLLLFTCYYCGAFAQNIDVAPFLLQCKGELTLQESIDCSENIIYDYFMRDVDEDMCPTDSAGLRLSIILEVKKNGKAKFSKIYDPGRSEDCVLYFENIAKEFCGENKFVPASYKGKNQVFDKKIVFNYPKPKLDTIDTTELYGLVEEMPRFNSCEYIIGTALDKEDCAKRDLLQFIYKNLKYPKKARKNGVYGMVVVQFIIDETGQVKDQKIVRDIGAGCGDAVLDVMDKMAELEQPFVPGIQFGKNVKVKYTLPVNFGLEKKKKRNN